MPDVWATVTQLDPTVQRRLAEVLETRGAEPRQQAPRTDFLGDGWRRSLRAQRCPRAPFRGRIVRRGRLRLDAEPRPQP